MTDPYLPDIQRREILRDYGINFGLRTFVETGTLVGDTPAFLAPYFDKLYTIELDMELYANAKIRFSGTNVFCLQGDSAKVLPVVLEFIKEPALFWLDGHWCGGQTKPEKDTPIIEELKAIFVTGLSHVILIDDTRLFEGMSHFGEHDWPHIDEIKKMAEAAQYSITIENDITRLIPENGR